MSKKTRQKKIIADLRRQLTANREMKLEVGGEKSFDSEPSTGRELRPNRLRTAELLNNEMRSGKKEIEKSHIPLPNPSSHLSLPSSTVYIKKDLTKTVILTILAISLELVLYFLSRAGRL